jgi:hypothetical protein
LLRDWYQAVTIALVAMLAMASASKLSTEGEGWLMPGVAPFEAFATAPVFGG